MGPAWFRGGPRVYHMLFGLSSQVWWSFSKSCHHLLFIFLFFMWLWLSPFSWTSVIKQDILLMSQWFYPLVLHLHIFFMADKLEFWNLLHEIRVERERENRETQSDSWGRAPWRHQPWAHFGTWAHSQDWLSGSQIFFLISTHGPLESRGLTFTNSNYLRTESQSECQFVNLYWAKFHKVFY